MMQLEVESECRLFALADIDILVSFFQKSFSVRKLENYYAIRLYTIIYSFIHEINK